MVNKPPLNPIDNEDLLPQRQLNVASLVPGILWNQLGTDEKKLNIGSFHKINGVVAQFRIYGPSSPKVLDDLASNTPSVIAVAYNTLYAYLVNALTAGGGLICEMSIHHLTVVFPVEGEGPRSGLFYQALVSVENAVNNLKGKTPPGYPDIHWHVSAGVAVGKLHVAILGNDFLGRKIALVGGPAKIQAEDALELARRSQMVVHKDIIKSLASIPEYEMLNNNYFVPLANFFDPNMQASVEQSYGRGNNGTPPLDIEMMHRLAAFLDPRILIRPPFTPLQKGYYTKSLTCIVVRLNGLALGNETSIDRWQAILEQVFDITARFGGLIDNVFTELGSGEIRIIFGVPDSQDYMERRAARCALALNRSLAGLDLTVQVGISASNGFAALLGTRYYSNYVVIAPAIDKANQLANRAESREILCDVSIRDATADLFSWREQVSALADKVYALAGEVNLGSGLDIRYQVTRQQPIVGRYLERDKIAETIKEVVEGEASILLVTGERGNGRSTLIDILIGQWLEGKGHGYVSLGSTYDPSYPYSMWLAVWQAIFELRQDESPKQKRNKLSQAFSRLLPDAEGGVAIFANLLGIDEDEGSLAYLTKEVRERRIFDATQTMLQRLSDASPLLLVFEHTDFSDELSLRLIGQLANALRKKPILFCLEDRRNPAHTLAKVFPKVKTIEAKPFTSVEAWTLLEQRLPKLELPYSYQKVIEKTFGHRRDERPRYKPSEIAVLITALEHVFFTKQGAQWKVNDEYTAQDIPEDEAEAIGWLLTKGMDEEERLVATRAAAFGIQFPHHANWLVNTASAVEVEHLEELRFAQRYADKGALERWSRFRHESLRETLYSQLDAETRTQVHHDIMKWYRAYMPGRASMALIAAHAERAGESAETVDAYLKAASFAADWGAVSEAQQHLLAAERHLARESEPDPELMLKLCLTYCNLHYVHNQVEAGVNQASRAVRYADEANNKTGLAHALLYAARFAQVKNDYDTMLASTGHALKLAEGDNQRQLITEATWLRAKALMATEQRREAVRLLIGALHTLDETDFQLEMRLDVARILLVDHYRERANEHVRHLMLHIERNDNPVLLQQILSLAGHMQLLYGNIPAALKILEEALTLPPPAHQGISPIADVLVNHAAALCYCGRYMDAESIFNTAIDYYDEDDNLSHVQLAKLIRAFEMYLDQENWDAIQPVLEDDWENFRGNRREEAQILVQLLNLSKALAHNDLDFAQKALTTLEALPDTPAKRWYLPLIYVRHSELNIARGLYDEAAECAYKSLGAVGIQGDLRYLPLAYTYLAEALIMVGNQSDEAIQDALNRAEKAGIANGRRIHLARALLLGGHYVHETSHLAKTRAAGSRKLYEAQSHYKEMGLTVPEKIARYGKKKETAETPS